MITELQMIGWLCFMRNQHECGDTARVPRAVLDALIARGWMEKPDEPDWQGREACSPTPAGCAITDLHGPDWGLDTIPEAADTG